MDEMGLIMIGAIMTGMGLKKLEDKFGKDVAYTRDQVTQAFAESNAELVLEMQKKKVERMKVEAQDPMALINKGLDLMNKESKD